MSLAGICKRSKLGQFGCSKALPGLFFQTILHIRIIQVTKRSRSGQRNFSFLIIFIFQSEQRERCIAGRGNPEQSSEVPPPLTRTAVAGARYRHRGAEHWERSGARCDSSRGLPFDLQAQPQPSGSKAASHPLIPTRPELQRWASPCETPQREAHRHLPLPALTADRWDSLHACCARRSLRRHTACSARTGWDKPRWRPC